LINWQFSKAITLPDGYLVANSGIGFVAGQAVPPPGLQVHDAFAAMEFSFNGSHGNAVALHTGNDGNLHTGWTFPDPTQFGIQVWSRTPQGYHDDA
jgi:hypothetical protein